MKSKSPTFDDFWRAYPLHKGKRDAERAWNRLSAGDKQKALAGIASYRDYIQQTGMAVKYPQGWLNGHRWEDEYDDVPVKAKPIEEHYETNDMETW